MWRGEEVARGDEKLEEGVEKLKAGVEELDAEVERLGGVSTEDSREERESYLLGERVGLGEDKEWLL